ncbi:MAG: hypothetical protein J6B43_11630 [Lachnospiraceae bacterium]|nr:hypothetical protein [Lachnospiraceae bacterium]
MRKMFSVIYYEYKMQMKRLATWGILLAATILSFLDNLPTARNLNRLEFLNEPAYFIYRVISLDSLVLLFGLMFLLAERFPLDSKTGMKSLFMTLAMQKWQYMLGKLLGGLLYTFSVLCIFLALCTTIYFAAAPFAISLPECIIPFVKAIFVSVLPVSLFVSFCSIALPGIMDIRLFYILAAVFWGANAAYVDSADANPFYLITSGDLVHLIWIHPEWSYLDKGSVLANGIFLMGSGLLFIGLLFLKPQFWRSE